MKKIYGTVSSRGVEAPIVNMMKINKTMDEENVVKIMKIFPQNDMKKFNQSFSRFIIFFYLEWDGSKNCVCESVKGKKGET